MTKRLIVALTAAMVAAIAGDVRAQSATTTERAGSALRTILTSDALTNAEYDALLEVLQRQATSFPIGSASGGFTYRFDPQLGVPARRTRSFGPMFADRPLTSGVRTLSVSFAFQQTAWQSVGGMNLKDGLTRTVLFGAADSVSGHPEGDIGRTQLDLRTSRTVIGATYGVTDRIDVGVLVPFGQTKISGGSTFTTIDLSAMRTIFTDHQQASGESFGLGDVTLRGKVAFLSRAPLDLAGGVDVRLPTGDRDDLLGSGSTQTKLMLIGAITRGDFAPHFNVGYTFAPVVRQSLALAGRAPLGRPDEFNYTIGGDFAVSGSFTIAADVIGRSLRNSVNVVQEVDGFDQGFELLRGTVHLLLGAVGGKVLIGHAFLLTASIAFPLNGNGVKPGITPVLGFERAF